MHRSLARLTQALIASVMLGAACSNPLFPHGDLRGTWAAAFSMPGFSLRMTLAQSDDAVTGTGTYSGEAGPSGTLAVRGDVHSPIGGAPNGPTIALLLTYDDGQLRFFAGRLLDAKHIVGILAVDSLGGFADSTTFVRQ